MDPYFVRTESLSGTVNGMSLGILVDAAVR